MVEQITPWLLGVSLVLGIAAALWRARRWSIGRPAPVAFWTGLIRFPRSYFVDLHHVVARDAYAARMHIATAGGFTAAVLLALLVHLIGLDQPVLAWLLVAALAVMAIGTALVMFRRLGGRPARLSRGGFSRLPFSLLAFVLFVTWVTLPKVGLIAAFAWNTPQGVAALALGVWGCLEMIAGLPVGPMKHAFAGALHLICHARPGRLTAACPDSALRPLDLEADKLGVETTRDFQWNQLLGFDACVQCGRCEEACPAFAAGLPLNPKKLIQDLAQAMAADGTDAGYAGSPHPDRPVGDARGGPDSPIIGAGAMIDPDTLWACTTCRACVQECPMMIEHVDAVVDLRRFETLEKGAVPGKGVMALSELRAADNPGGRRLDTRLDWAADLSLPLIAERIECEVLLWLGEGAFELRNQRTLRALIRLLRHADVDFAVLGAEELDCGDLARRLGDEATFQDLARRNIETLDRYRFQRIVTADPHVFHCIGNEYPAIGGRYEVIHHSTFLARLLEDGRLNVTDGDRAGVTYHDPCYLGRYNGELEAPRSILRALGVEFTEMERSGMRSMCCGWGGGAAFTDIPGKRRIPDVRMDQVRETGAPVVAVACPNCAVMLEGVVGPSPEVADVAELLLAAVEAGA